ncbi:hypothetical protein ACWKTS_32995 [Bacillus toyonensis]
MKKQYDEMLKKQCVELVIKEGRTISSIQREFEVLLQSFLNEIKMEEKWFCCKVSEQIKSWYDCRWIL